MKPISRKEALEISAGILKQAEAERLAVAGYGGISFNLYRKDGEFRLDCDALGISLSAATLSRLFLELQDDLLFIYEEYGQCKSTDIMSLNALVLRDKIQELMEDEI